MAKKKASGGFGKRVSGSTLTEGKVRKGGVKPKPLSPKPNITPAGQKQPPKKKN